jgi:hypothetical protein
MLHRFRVLNAILALREFTVADLAHYSGVKVNTVRTVLGRDSHFVECLGAQAQAQGRRGGQPIQYRLRADTEHELVGVLRQLEDVGADLPPLAERCSEVDPAVLALTAAEDVLLRQLPAAVTADRAQLYDLAVADFEMVQFLATRGEAAVHRAVVDLLLRLTEVEQEALALNASSGTNALPRRQKTSALAAPSHEAEKKLEALGRDLYKLLQLLQRRPVERDVQLLPDLFHRIGTSPFGAVVSAFCKPESDTPGA